MLSITNHQRNANQKHNEISPHTQDGYYQKPPETTSVVVQWLRIHLVVKGTRVRALVWEDPTCCGAAKPVRHNY